MMKEKEPLLHMKSFQFQMISSKSVEVKQLFIQLMVKSYFQIIALESYFLFRKLV